MPLSRNRFSRFSENVEWWGTASLRSSRQNHLYARWSLTSSHSFLSERCRNRRIILPLFNQQESSFSPSRKPFFDNIDPIRKSDLAGQDRLVAKLCLHPLGAPAPIPY